MLMHFLVLLVPVLHMCLSTIRKWHVFNFLQHIMLSLSSEALCDTYELHPGSVLPQHNR